MRIVRGASIELHEVQEEHLLLLAEWRNSEDFMRLCSTRRNTVTPVEFAAELDRDLNRDRHEQFLIWRKGTYVGTIYSYNLNCTDGYAFVTTFIAKAWRARGYGAAAMVVFIDYLFREYDLHKVYTEVYSYNRESLSALTSGGFVEEGRFRGHRLYEDERHDLIRLAFFRSQIPNAMHLVHRLTGRTTSA